jgi:hypothetical protein
MAEFSLTFDVIDRRLFDHNLKLLSLEFRDIKKRLDDAFN